MKLHKNLYFAAIIILLNPCNPLYAAKEAKDDVPDKIGNFLLPTSQMPGPLFGFGQNVVDQDDFQLFFNILQSGSKKINYTTLIPGLLYGIRDDLSLFMGAPIAPLFKIDNQRSHGIQDLFVQLEYTLFTKTRMASATQATLVGNITLPFGSSNKNPPTGLGLPGFFLGATLSHTALYWYAWIQGGAILTLNHHGTKFGNQFLYQSGIEGVIATTPSKWLIAWIVELFGIYEQKDTICSRKNNNSGGNTFYIGPSLWASSEKWLIQLGIAFPTAQHLFGEQPKIRYFLESYIAYKFN